MPLYRDNAIVLRTYKLAEADRIIVFVTAEHGEVRAVANGVRKPKSKFGGRLEPLSHVNVQFHQGRGELQRVSQVESIDHFKVIRTNLDRLGKAAALCELIDQVGHGRHDGRLYPMLLGALRSLERDDAALIVPAFTLKLLAEEGLGVHVTSCVVCSASEVVSFDTGEGGALCRDHRRGVAVSNDAAQMMAMILGGQLVAALQIPESAVTHEVEHVARAAMEHHLERRLKAPTALGMA